MATVQDYYDPQLPTLLFSLHPQPAAAIAAGDKVIEFRRRFYPRAFQAFIYTTGKQGGIGSYVQCAPAITAAPAVLGQLGARLQGDDPQATVAYLAPASTGLAIPVTSAITFEPVSLADLKAQFPNFVAPRSYVYLDRPPRRDQLAYLLDQDCQTVHQNKDVLTKIKHVLSNSD